MGFKTGNKILFWLFFLLVGGLCGTRAHGQCTIAAGSSLATINSAISTAASNSCGGSIHNEALFAAGVSNVAWASGGSQINIPCPTSAGVIITGPTTTYDQPGVLNAWAARPTATLRNTNTGESFQLISTPGGCTNAITITYLEVDGNRPLSGGGAVYVGYGSGGPSAATSNLTIEYNYFHGNQSQAQAVCGVNCVSGGQDFASHEIYLDGYNGGSTNSGTYLSNSTIDHNVFGAGSPSNPTAGDCGNIMQWTGVCTAQGNPANYNPPNCTPGTGGCDSCIFVGYNSQGGQCAALGVHTSTINFHFDYNKIIQEEQDTKWYEGGGGGSSSPYSLYFQVNDTSNYNDFGTYHRIATEDQQSSVNYSVVPAPTTCSLSPGSACMNRNFNDVHDNYTPAFGTWGFSLPNIGYHNEIGNLMIANDHNSANQAGPADFEYWGFGQGNNNLDQSYNACAFSYGYNSTAQQIENNVFQVPAGGNCLTAFAINDEEGQNTPIISGNTNSTSFSQLTSTAPSFSPNGGGFSGSVAVTLTDNGNTGVGPQGNTGIWCTTDGSAPAPKSGTAIYYPTGYVLTLNSTTTLKCVGMWGAQNQPAPAGNTTADVVYPSGFGYLPSSTVSATFTGGGTPTAATPVFTPPSQNFTSSQTFTITSSTAGASIYYCTGACTPTTSSTLYTGAITTSATTTYNAIAVAAGFVNSAIGTATYTLAGLPTAVTPTFTPGTQTFTTALSISLTTTTPSSTIYYCLGSCTPTTSSTPYTVAIPVSSTTTINAIAVASGYVNSAVGTATYTYQLFLGNNLLDNTTSNTYPGAANGIYAVTGSALGGYTVTGCVVNQGTATVTNGAHTACFVTSANSPTTQAANALCSGSYTNTSTTGTIANITMSGCPTLLPGAAYFVSSVTDDTLQPSGLGFHDCNGGTCTGGVPTVGVGTYASFYFFATYGTYTGLPTTLSQGVYQVTQYLTLAPNSATTATPVISPASQSFSGTLSVSMADSTAGSSIYYTTDGTTPVPGSNVIATNADTSLTGWDTCVIGSCPGGGTPGGTGTPTAHAQTIGNASPAGAPSGTSMLVSQTANANSTNALWTFKAPTTCDLCTILSSSLAIYLGATNASNVELDNFNFSVTKNYNYMAGHQYNRTASLWQVWNGATASWVNTSVSAFMTSSAWHTIAFSDTITTCSGVPGIQFNGVTIDSTFYAFNLCEPVATLPSGYTSAVGTQIQLDQNTVSGSQTVTANIDNVDFTAANGTTQLYTAPFNVTATTTANAIATSAGNANSAVASNTFTLSTGTISSVYLTSASGVNYVVPGGTDQFIVHVVYSDGTQTVLPRVSAFDARGSILTSIASAATALATINQSLLLTGVSNTVQPNWTTLTAVVTDSSSGTHNAVWTEGVAASLVSGIQ
jgi:hypothetical protein